MINACPNLTVLKLDSYDSKEAHRSSAHSLFEKIILKCKKLEIFNFSLGSCEEPVSINCLASEISQNLVNLKQLYLPDWYLSANNVRLLTKNIPSLKMVRVHDRMFASASVTQSELSNFAKGSDFYNQFENEKQDTVETEIF